MQFRSLHHVALLFVVAFVQPGCHSRRGVIHRVESGDSLIQLAHIYDVELKEILAANHFSDPNKLRPGEKILIPGGGYRRSLGNSLWESEDLAGEIESEPESPEIPPPAPPQPSPPFDQPRIAAATPQKKRKWGSLYLSWPAEGRIISTYGMRNKKMHNGIDLHVQPGSPIQAISSGKVAYRGNDVPGYGNLVIVKHLTNLFSVYAYLDRISVAKGTPVKRGTVLGQASQVPSDAFVHLELRKGKRALNPLRYLPR